jgi:aminoglycoside/choline kinase family phosphotransferase
MGVADARDSRLEALTRWVHEDLGFGGSRIAPASADASFRRYFRVTHGTETYIVMDAPPGKEDLGPFLDVAHLLADIGVHVPAILARDVQNGYLLLSDLGNVQYLQALRSGDPDRLYADALRALLAIQRAPAGAARGLPVYDAARLTLEMQLLPQWFLTRHLGLELGTAELALLERLFAALTAAALEQPQCIVHRDYHSRNLLVTALDNPGIIDFQDAVIGPVTYDAVSLLKDCYIAWPEARVRGWALSHRQALLIAGVAAGDEAQFLRWFDLMGLQRHIKVLGIFARLFYRDGKSQYLHDLPLVLDYVRTAAAHYPEAAEFHQFLDQRVVPRFEAAQRRVLA